MEHLSAKLPSDFGNFSITVYKQELGRETVVLSTPRLAPHMHPLVRIHSECLTGDTFGSLRCDCGPQKEASLRMIAESGNGVFIYLRQEGRGIGLFEKIKAYKLQEDGHDTYEANILLGHDADGRTYAMAKNVLDDLGIDTIKLITNNPKKVTSMRELGVHVAERIPLIIEANAHNKHYLDTKKKKFGHHFND
ncbi:MAG TPA: GTP cyclohydrolase II [Candidatus Paceibacterota bacterium]|nr:GTP cyclohydrolase II [Candidatus Paceibacterota bacterium]